jgi:hypothetical protein
MESGVLAVVTASWDVCTEGVFNLFELKFEADQDSHTDRRV